MTQNGQGQITVQKNGNWLIYINRVPEGMEPLGTVTRSETGEVGALMRVTATGVYVQVNGGAVRSLDQRQVLSGLKP